MASRSFTRSTITSTYPKYADFLVGNAAYDPAAMIAIATVTAAGGETSLSFTSIPQTYSALQIYCLAKGQGTAAGQVNFLFTVNSDTGNNYTAHHLFGNGTTVTAQGYATGGSGYAGFWAYRVPTSYAGLTSIFGAGIIDLHDYASTSKYKTMRFFNGIDNNATSGANSYATLGSGVWTSTSAITSLQLSLASDTFAAGSTFSLYGIKG